MLLAAGWCWMAMVSLQIKHSGCRSKEMLTCILLAHFLVLSSSFCVRTVTDHHRSNPVLLSQQAEDSIEEQIIDHPVGLYVHIPYCRRRCRYCDFAIVPIGTRVSVESISSSNTEDDRATRGFEEMNKKYQSALLTELQRVQQECKNKIQLRSIYFGGGTPSLAPVETIAAILEHAIGKGAPFYLTDDAEVSIEMDPGTFSLQKLEDLKSLGINRISLGVQSFDDKLLENMGRIHRRAEVFEAIQMIDQVFGSDANYSIDLITGVPGLTLTKWVATLQQATSLIPKPSHMSIYDLQIEQGTVFSSWYDQNSNNAVETKTNANQTRLMLPTEDECAFMYKYSAGYLRSKDYEHYEVSSYAYRGEGVAKRSKHNQIYWAPSSSWYAIGLGATSSVNGTLVARPRTLADYYSWLEKEQQGLSQDELPQEELLTDLVMKRLRTSDGLDIKGVKDRFGDDVVSSILEGAKLGLELGLAEHCDETNTLRLKDPDGLLFSNYIISSIFAELEEN
jgi:putative oxygen-independent coproporphyrinogen III oxidase